MAFQLPPPSVLLKMPPEATVYSVDGVMGSMTREEKNAMPEGNPVIAFQVSPPFVLLKMLPKVTA